MSLSKPLPSLRFIPLPAPLDSAPARPDAVALTATGTSSYPCRRCLTNASTGENILLLSYNAFLGSSPYTGPGPIFVHREPCDVVRKQGEEVFHEDGVPHQLRRGIRSVRAYDEAHMMRGARVVEGEKLRTTMEEMFQNKDVAYIHVHFAGEGCFAARVERGPE